MKVFEYPENGTYHVTRAKLAEPFASKFCGPRIAAQAVLLKRIAASTGGGGGGRLTVEIAKGLVL